MEYRIIEISLARAELLLGMEEIAFITADALMGVEEKRRSVIQDITQEGRIGFVNNFLNMAWGELLHTLTAYTKKGILEDVLSDNEYQEPEHYVVRLRVPETFPVHSVNVLTSTMQAFLINKAVGHFFSIVRKEDAEMYLMMAADCLLKVKKYLNTRVFPTRVGLGVF